MRDIRALLSAISPAGLMIPVLLSALLLAQSMSGMTAEVDQARCLVDDWGAALETFESGRTTFTGRCLGASIGAPGEDLGWVREQLEQVESDYEAAVDRLTEDPWKRAANYIGGTALVFFALWVGGMASGSPMGSAVAAWGLSNSWTRRSWARSTLTLTALASLGAYLLALVVAMVVIYTKISGAGIDAGLPAPGLSALNPIPGLLYFGMLGVLAGLITGRGEIAGMTAVVVAIADFMGSARFELAPFFPTSWHQTALGATPSPISIPTALGLAGAAAVGLAWLAYWLMTRRRDIPDR